ncbi:MAG: hypothetical protein MUE85_22270 [Microscillaceae bacterium]|jgi:hypothetical protein|nr:hypothetical protein [Microscillaceae bacterium]
MSEILAKLAPKKLDKVLKTYIATWSHNAHHEYSPTPLITFYLLGGNIIGGELIHIDLVERLLSLKIWNEEKRLDVVFLDLGQVQTFVLHDLEKCPIFVEELAKV